MSINGRSLPAWKYAGKNRIDYPQNAADWDRWYANPAYEWTPASAAVRAELDRVRPGRALDLGAGDGRHAVWLAGRGWQVDAADFSPEALWIGEERSAAEGLRTRIRWSLCDVTTRPFLPRSVDLVLAAFLHIPGAGTRQAFANAAPALVDGGIFLYLGLSPAPDGNPLSKPELPFDLPDIAEVTSWLEQAGLHVERAETRARPVPGTRRPALDCVVLARAGTDGRADFPLPTDHET